MTGFEALARGAFFGCLALSACGACGACTPNNSPVATQTVVVEDAQGGEAQVMRVGNQAKGVQEQPDYDASAATVRDAVEGRLPDPLPDEETACRAMLEAVHAQYVEQEGRGSEAVAALEATRDDDMTGCVQETSPAAASCVTILTRQGEGEYPWLLDQCSRAFPAG